MSKRHFESDGRSDGQAVKTPASGESRSENIDVTENQKSEDVVEQAEVSESTEGGDPPGQVEGTPVEGGVVFEVGEVPVEGQVAAPAEERSALAPDVQQRIDVLQAEVDRLKKPRRVASGSKARPNVKYTLLKRPPKWSDTPQIAQLEEILFGQDKRELLEPELFDLIKKGAEAGVLRTKQNPVRIFQYYRSDLIKDNVLVYR